MNKNAIQLHQVAVELQQSGALREACEAYQKALDLDPRLELSRSNLATVQFQLGEIDQALFNYWQLLEEHPLNVKARFNLAGVYSSIGRYEQAIAEYRKVLELQPGHAMALHNLAWILGQQQRHGEAIATLEQLLEINPNDPGVTFQLGQSHKLTGDMQRAESLWRTAATQDPHHLPSRLALAEISYLSQDWKATLKWALEALSADPNHTAAQIMAARAQIHLLEYRQATERLIALGKKHPNIAEVHYHLGSLLHTLDRLPEARHHLSEAVRLSNGNHFEYHNEFGTVLYRIGDYQAAAEQFRDAESLAPDNAVVKANLGFAYFMLGERNAAEQYFAAFLANPAAQESVKLSVNCALDLL